MIEPPNIPTWVQHLGTFLLVASPSLALVVAYAVDKDARGLRPWLYGALALADVGAFGLGGLFALTGMLTGLQGIEPAPALGDGFMSAFLSLGIWTMGTAVVALVLLLPPVRRGLARLIPIDPTRLVHAVALQLAALTVWVSGAIAIFMPVLMADPEGMAQIGEATAQAGLTGLWVQNAAFVVLSVLGVGALVQRDWRATLERLGLTQAVSLKWWIGGAALALVVAVATDQLWTMLDPAGAAELGKLSDQLFGPLIATGGIAAALTIGLAPGIGEELLFRGAAQPRFGLIATSLLFAAVHTQYTISWALVQILIVGLILGTVRNRAGTRTAILVHATFNAAQVLLSLAG